MTSPIKLKIDELCRAPIKPKPSSHYLQVKISNELAFFLNIDTTKTNRFIKIDILNKLQDYIVSNKLYQYTGPSLNYNLIVNDYRFKLLFNLDKVEYDFISESDINRWLDRHLIIINNDLTVSNLPILAQNDVEEVIKCLRSLKNEAKRSEEIISKIIKNKNFSRQKTDNVDLLDAYIIELQKQLSFNIIYEYELSNVKEVDFYNIVYSYITQQLKK